MALNLISSNRVETLQKLLAQLLRSSPLRDPMRRELIIVPGMAMSRWLNLQLARSHGVAANIDYPLVASWIWQLSRELLPEVPEQDPLSREQASWRVYRLLPSLLDREEFHELKHYLQGDEDGVRGWQLSLRIADVFDRYQLYRPDWIRLWSQGVAAPGQIHWQMSLWQALLVEVGDKHRVAQIDKLLQNLSLGTDADRLPERLCGFALSSVPPLFMEVFQALGKHSEVVLFQHSPTDQYWADLKSKKELSRLRLKAADVAEYYDSGNDLLASWGRQAQVFQDLLLEQNALEAAQLESYQTPGTDTLLHRLQQDIFCLQDAEIEVTPDESLQIAVCHSALRECQVLHDQLLREMQHDPSLKPEDILVMVPEISRYAPYIEAVFRKDESSARPFIPWNLSDITLADEHPLIRIFFQLLSLPGSRFSFSEVVSCLDVPEIAARFSLNAQDCAQLRVMLQQANVRWGLDAQHKTALGLPAIHENTWLQAEQRLLAGYAMDGTVGDEDEMEADAMLWNSIAPLDVADSSRAAALGRFCLLLDRLRVWRVCLQGERSAEQWQRDLNQLLADFFAADGEDDDRLQQIRDALHALREQAGAQKLSLALLSLCLNDSLGKKSSRGRFFSGGVTFCGMRPMRSLPFRIICLLGMNDQAFPRRDTAIEFDAMASQWRAGDPRKGDEDRYLLLETLLCARQKLYLSYTGRSLRDNGDCQPSVLLRELLDFVDTRYRLEGERDTPISTKLSRVHSMQAFSPRNYQVQAEGKGEKPGQQSYDRHWCQVARILAAPRQEADSAASITAWPSTALPALDSATEHMELTRLRRFLQNPVEYFFRNRLRITLHKEDEHEDEESFTVEGLQAWQIKNRMAENSLRALGTSCEQLQAEALLPHGSLAQTAYAQLQQDAAPLLEKLEEFQGLRAEPQRIDLRFDAELSLSGQIGQFMPGKGLLHFTPSSFKGKNLLALWVDHLALCASGIMNPDSCSVLFCRDRGIRFAPLDPQLAAAQLQQYVDLYQEGMRRPLPIFPGSSCAYASCIQEKGHEAALKAAYSKWRSNGYNATGADQEDPYVCLALRGCEGDPLQEEEFAELAQQLYSTALKEAEDL